MKARLRPRQRSRGTQPAIAAVTIRGPYNATGPGDTPSRERIFICRPKDGQTQDAAEAALRQADPIDLDAPGVSTSRHRADLAALMPFYEKGRKERDFDLGIQTAIERLLVSPQFLFRIERDPAGAHPGAAHPVSDLELASRLSFFLWSSIPGRRAAARRRSRQAAGPRRAGTAGPAHAGRSALGIAGHQLRRAVAVPARRRRKDNPTCSCSGTSTTACATPSSGKPICSSTASCAKIAACWIC